MRVLLKLGLAGILVGVAVLIFCYPEDSKEYVNTRYKAFHEFAISSTPIATYLKSNLVTGTSLIAFKLLAVIIAVGGVPLLLNLKLLTILYAYLIMIVGGLLHMPYETELLYNNVVGQIRKLIVIFTIFCGMLIVVSTTRSSAPSVSKAKKE